MSTTVNKTDSRVTALRDVEENKITYNTQTGAYHDNGEPVSGARRRTLAELRRAGLISGEAPVVLTRQGRSLMTAWEG